MLNHTIELNLFSR